MNPPPPAPPDPAALVRRCADGELSAADRPALRAALVADPSLCEPLAAALLERQAIAAALRSAVADASPASPSAPTPAPAPRPWRRAAGLLAATAAGLAAGLGVNVSAFDSQRESPAPVLLADASPAVPPPPAPVPQPVAELSWADAGVTVPVYDAAAVPPGFGAGPLTDADRAALIAAGRYAGEWRQEYTVPLDDGRLLTIPVHAVGVRGPEVF